MVLKPEDLDVHVKPKQRGVKEIGKESNRKF